MVQPLLKRSMIWPRYLTGLYSFVLLSFQVILICNSFLFSIPINVYDNGDLKDAPPSSKPPKKYKPVIICGDLNVAAAPIDLKNPKPNEKNAGYTIQEREAFQRFLDAGYTDSFRYLYPDKVQYSWWSYRFKAREKNAGWRIDYFLTSDSAKDQIVDAKIHTDIMGSDHCPVSLDINI